MEDKENLNFEETEAQSTEAEAKGTEENAKEAEEEVFEEEKSPKKFGKDSKKLKKAEAEIEKLKEELKAEKDKYLLLYAEYDNFRRRSAKEKESAYTDSYFEALLQILPILDNLERAASFAPEDAESPMAKGLELTLKSFVETMNKMGVYEIEALGKEFDPNFHNAVMHVEDDTAADNTVVEVFMKGYAKGDKVLRYSMVKVAN